MQAAQYIHPDFIRRWEAVTRGRLAGLPEPITDRALAGWHARIGERDPQTGSPVRIANTWARELADALRAAKLGRAYSEEKIADFADNYARICSRMPTLEARTAWARTLGIEAPAGRGITDAGKIARFDDAKWWRRRLRAAWTRAAEEGQRALSMVRRGAEVYASDQAVQHRARRVERTRVWMEGRALVNDDGDQLGLLDVADRSIANPAIRRGEFMTRVRGFEEIAAQLGHVPLFLTLTAPSAFHPELSAGGRNPAYNGATVREAQAYLCRTWARARAQLARLRILFYGVRVAEPHHDGTPHWHALIFVRARDRDAFERIITGAWCAEYREELTSDAARAARMKIITIDAAQGSATGYVAKYVSKNIDAAGSIGEATSDETGAPIASTVERVAAWSQTHGIRQFQQLGGPPVGLWREFRRLRAPVADPDLEAVRAAADRGDWAAFVFNSGGIALGRRTNPRIERHAAGTLNRYAEERAALTVGVRYASALALTRPHTWRIERRTGSVSVGLTAGRELSGARPSVSLSGSESSAFSDLGPVAITVRHPGFDWREHPLDDRASADFWWLDAIKTADYLAGPPPAGPH